MTRVRHRTFLLATVAMLLAGAADAQRRTGGGTLDRGGWEARRRPFVPFVEGRLILGSGSAFQIVGGFNFKLQ